MSYGKKCNIIFIRKVHKRLEELEERYKEEQYKDWKPQTKAEKVNQELMNNFCVDVRQIERWKKIVETVDTIKTSESDTGVVPEEIPPTMLHEISRAPKEKQVELAKEVLQQKLSKRETKALVDKELGIEKVKQEEKKVERTKEVEEKRVRVREATLEDDWKKFTGINKLDAFLNDSLDSLESFIEVSIAENCHAVTSRLMEIKGMVAIFHSEISDIKNRREVKSS